MRAKLLNGLYILQGFVVGDIVATKFEKTDETLL